ncbi:MAG: DUF5131 family protein [Candidatus Marinimicrobia bacterium]|nr:DUF5131 family protein [Candidatus Neomarinimicrobiota bacterium]
MSQKSEIEWTESTWNPVTGCSKISAGCKNCYAETMAYRLKAMGQQNYVNGFKLTLQPHMLEKPLQWKSSQIIFVNSMSDLFHESVPLSYIKEVFATMNKANWHHFQILTKRSERLKNIHKQLDWSPHIWMGVSVENQDMIPRIDHLRNINAGIKFLSLEPLIGPISNLNLNNIDWVIAGGESGHNARPVKEDWIIDIRDQCEFAGVPFFFKQWGGFNKKKNGRVLEGRTWDEMPEIIKD